MFKTYKFKDGKKHVYDVNGKRYEYVGTQTNKNGVVHAIVKREHDPKYPSLSGRFAALLVRKDGKIDDRGHFYGPGYDEAKVRKDIGALDASLLGSFMRK